MKQVSFISKLLVYVSVVLCASFFAGCGSKEENKLNNPPDRPENLTATAQSPSGIIVTWNNVYDADYYIVYRDGANVSGKIKTTTFTDNNLSQSTTYQYYVIAYNSYGESPMSDVVQGTTKIDIDNIPYYRLTGTWKNAYYGAKIVFNFDKTGYWVSSSNQIDYFTYNYDSKNYLVTIWWVKNYSNPSASFDFVPIMDRFYLEGDDRWLFIKQLNQ